LENLPSGGVADSAGRRFHVGFTDANRSLQRGNRDSAIRLNACSGDLQHVVVVEISGPNNNAEALINDLGFERKRIVFPESATLR
jgi:hypothetical protein